MPDAIYSAGDFSSQPRFIFDRFTNATDGLANIRTLVGQTPQVFETNYLEFKNGLVQADDLKHKWSQALGSFANSGGGVVIWGIRAERDPVKNVDAVQGESPVPDVEKLATKLREYQPPATDPPIKGVMIHPVLLPGETTKGFVVCLIPESDAKPHRSEFGKNDVKRFNLRIGDSTQECTVPLLRQLFYPKTAQRAEVTFQRIACPDGLVGTFFQFGDKPLVLADKQDIIVMSVKNTGTLTIHEPSILVVCETADYLTFEWNDSLGRFDLDFPSATIFLGRILHPMLSKTERFIFVEKSASKKAIIEVLLFARDLIPLHARIDYKQITKAPWVTHTLPLSRQ